MKEILVIGGGGFIGTHLVNRLRKGDNKITVLDPQKSTFFKGLNPNSEEVTFLKLDVISALKGGDIFLGDFDVIFHLAGTSYVPSSIENPINDLEANILSTITILEQLKSLDNTPKLIFSSSAAVYGNPKKLPIQEGDPTNPLSPYGVSKLSAERYISVYNHLFGVSAASMRIFSIYGPGLEKQVIFDFLEKLRNDPNNLEIIGDGEQERDFLYIEDLIEAMLIIEKKAPMNGEVYNIASGKSITINKLINIICSMKGINPNIIHQQPRLGDPKKWVVNTERILNLGFSPNYSIKKGLSFTIRWFEERQKLVDLKIR